MSLFSCQKQQFCKPNSEKYGIKRAYTLSLWLEFQDLQGLLIVCMLQDHSNGAGKQINAWPPLSTETWYLSHIKMLHDRYWKQDQKKSQRFDLHIYKQADRRAIDEQIGITFRPFRVAAKINIWFFLFGATTLSLLRSKQEKKLQSSKSIYDDSNLYTYSTHQFKSVYLFNIEVQHEAIKVDIHLRSVNDTNWNIPGTSPRDPIQQFDHNSTHKFKRISNSIPLEQLQILQLPNIILISNKGSRNQELKYRRIT